MTTNDQDLNCDPLGRGAEDCDATPARGLSHLMIIIIVIDYNFNIIWIENGENSEEKRDLSTRSHMTAV